MEQEFNKQDIVESLRNGICVVTFVKVNGDTRVMKCTLEGNYLPEDHNPTTDTDHTENNVVNCWDIEANGWRSFRVDLIVRFDAFVKSDNGVYKHA